MDVSFLPHVSFFLPHVNSLRACLASACLVCVRMQMWTHLNVDAALEEGSVTKNATEVGVVRKGGRERCLE